MPNQIPVPRFKRGDRVRETHVIRLKTVKVSRGASKIPENIKPKRGLIVSEPYRDKPDKAGRRRFKYDVQWDGRTHTDSVLQHRLTLEEKDYNQNDSTVKTNG